jgi:diguanylate cyclase (GGDEF)-like protein
MLLAELDALVDWRAVLFRKTFYSDYPVNNTASRLPDNIVVWCEQQATAGQLDRNLFQKLKTSHEDLELAARQFADSVAEGKRPPIDFYDTFENQYISYLGQVRRLHQDVSDSGMSIDPLTGLRTVSGMMNELQREQDRFDRKGTPYSLAYIGIDDIQQLQQTLSRRDMDIVFGAIGQHLGKMIRTFDDGYYFGRGEYLVVLKHVEFTDACTAVERMRRVISETPVFTSDKNSVKVNVSIGIAESLLNEKAQTMIDNAKSVFKEAQIAGGDRVVVFYERSALEKYKLHQEKQKE